jgi:hypothetical protein
VILELPDRDEVVESYTSFYMKAIAQRADEEVGAASRASITEARSA